eukprot:11260299-Ditylum_brightwellii.AAC.1
MSQDTRKAAKAKGKKPAVRKPPETSDLESEDELLEVVTLSRETLASFAKTIASAVATAIATYNVAPYVSTHSIALDPYDTSSFNVATKEGKYQWAIMTKMQEDWKQLTCTTDLANQFLDLFKDRQTQFGLDILIRTPMEGNSKIQAKPQTLVGVKHWDADLREFKTCSWTFTE